VPVRVLLVDGTCSESGTDPTWRVGAGVVSGIAGGDSDGDILLEGGEDHLVETGMGGPRERKVDDGATFARLARLDSLSYGPVYTSDTAGSAQLSSIKKEY
jgi:hypothetical protein